jgi:AraC-like DNA-binding protein
MEDLESANGVSVQTLAESVGLSTSRLQHIFKREAGLTIGQYITHVKLDRACQYLLKTDQPIKRICSDSGFSDPSNFVRLFRKYRGQTPSEFRKLNRSRFDQ